MFNQETGQDTFNTATLLSTQSGMPVLEFSYGVETRFPDELFMKKFPRVCAQNPLWSPMSKMRTGENKIWNLPT